MQVNSNDQQQLKPHHTCPKLGLRDDPATFSAFPSQINACYHVKPVATPKLSHQHAYCLHSNHTICPVFKAPAGGKMPKEIIHETRGLDKKTRYRLIGVGTLLIVTVLILWLSLGNRAGFLAVEESSPTVTERISTAVTNPQVTATQKLPQPTPSRTALSPTVTEPPATPTEEDPVLALDTPIGDELQFIIHRVQEGETLSIFANQYNTSVESISAINHNLIVPLWANWLIIIPLNNTAIDDLPAFEAHQVVEEDIRLEDLAAQLSTSLDDMMQYNNLDADHTLHDGEWVLVPRERP